MTLPSEDLLRELVSRYAGLLAAHGEAFEGAELVTPTSAHFPDHFARDQASIQGLLARVVSYTPLGEDVPLEVAFAEDAADDGHCTSGCSKPGSRIDGVQRVGAGYRIVLPITETSNPTRLVCGLARGVSSAVLAEAEVAIDPNDVGLMSEVVAAASGFGLVMLEGSHVYTKSCGGPSIHQGTYLGPSELAVLLAIFCALHEVPARAARKHLSATQRETFDEAAAFVDAHRPLIDKLRAAPELLEGGAFSFEPTRGFLSRLLSSSAKPAAPKAERDSKRSSAADDELRALVEKEFG